MNNHEPRFKYIISLALPLFLVNLELISLLIKINWIFDSYSTRSITEKAIFQSSLLNWKGIKKKLDTAVISKTWTQQMFDSYKSLPKSKHTLSMFWWRTNKTVPMSFKNVEKPYSGLGWWQNPMTEPQGGKVILFLQIYKEVRRWS